MADKKIIHWRKAYLKNFAVDAALVFIAFNKEYGIAIVGTVILLMICARITIKVARWLMNMIKDIEKEKKKRTKAAEWVFMESYTPGQALAVIDESIEEKPIKSKTDTQVNQVEKAGKKKIAKKETKDTPSNDFLYVTFFISIVCGAIILRFNKFIGLVLIIKGFVYLFGGDKFQNNLDRIELDKKNDQAIFNMRFIKDEKLRKKRDRCNIVLKDLKKRVGENGEEYVSAKETYSRVAHEILFIYKESEERDRKEEIRNTLDDLLDYLQHILREVKEKD